VAVLSSDAKFSVIELPSNPATQATAELILDMNPYGRAWDGFRVSDDGGEVLFADNWNEVVAKIDLGARGVATAPTVLADKNALSRDGHWPTGVKAFDMTGNGGEWWTFAWASYDGRPRYWLNHGQPAGVAHEVLPLGDEEWSDWFQVSDDGSVMLYCLDYDFTLNNPQACWLQEPGTSNWTAITGDQGNLGEPALADGGAVAYVLDEWNQGTSYGFRFSTCDPQQRRVAGTQWLADSSRSEFDNVEMSDDGRILASPTDDGVYVQHDGFSAPLGFPSLDNFSSQYDATADELVVQVNVAPGSAPLDRIYTLPLYRGIEPDRILDPAQNPLYWDRYGGGVFAGTIFTQVGASSTWERRIPLEGKFGLLTDEFALRIVAVDAQGHRTSYYDFVPMAIFGDGFESGGLGSWSSSLP
jgi:hypothetical protein